MTKERQLKYEWRRTWPDKLEDFTGWDGDWQIGRVHRHHLGNWLWTMYFDAGGPVEVSRNGSNDDKMGACKDVEAAYDAEKEKRK
jgi:hypothetical protein